MQGVIGGITAQEVMKVNFVFLVEVTVTNFSGEDDADED